MVSAHITITCLIRNFKATLMIFLKKLSRLPLLLIHTYKVLPTITATLISQLFSTYYSDISIMFFVLLHVYLITLEHLATYHDIDIPGLLYVLISLYYCLITPDGYTVGKLLS